MKNLLISKKYFLIKGIRNLTVLICIFYFLVNSVSEIKCGPRVKSFHCINGNYVFANWFCDGVNDCGDSSDEFYGCDQQKCGFGNFTCEDQKCFPISVRCNGISDCADGSDEKFCDHEPQLANCDINQGQFLCKDKLRCIELGYVCDGDHHCFDGSDETERCYEHDPAVCNHCYHACLRTPIGPYCFYNKTTDRFEEASKDIGHCEPLKNNCDQKCTSFKERYQCSCEENFSYNYTFFNTLICVEKDKDKNVLLYVTPKGIKSIRGYSNQSTLIMPYNENITAISAANDFVYWGGIYLGVPVIGKISLQGGIKNIIVTQGIEDLSVMDVDWRTGNIYFIDNKRKHLAACNENGTRCIEIIKILHIATGLSLAPRYGIMFWSTFEEDEGYVIRKSDLNGESDYPIISDGLRHVISISVDETSEKIYWLDIVRRRIEVAQFNGNGRKIFKADLRMNYLAISVNANFLYWILANNSTIQYSPGRRTQPRLAYNDSDPVSLLYGYSYSEKTTKMLRPCDWGCDGICLLTSNYFNRTGSYCVCTNKTTMNGKWCREDAQSIFNIVYHDEIIPLDYGDIPDSSSNNTKVVLFMIIVIICTIGGAAYFQRQRLFTSFNIIRHTRF